VSPFVKAPNGDVYDLDQHVASGLVNGIGSKWEYSEAPTARGTARKRGKAGAEVSAARRRAAKPSVEQPTSETEDTDTTSDQSEETEHQEGDASDAGSTAPDDTGAGGTESETSEAEDADVDDESEEVGPEASDAPEPADVDGGDPASKAPANNASTAAWAEYAATFGIDTAGLTRDQIREKVAKRPVGTK